MQVIETPFEGLLEIIPTLYQDSRGWFYESFKETTFKAAGINYRFVQENQSFSRKGVIRGLHFQRDPHAQAKLASVLMGKVLDVVVDLRPASRTFGQVYTCVLDGVRRNMLMVPDGFAHGFAALEDSFFFYKCSNFYHKESESGIIWNDPQLAINWQVENPIVSEKDQLLPTLDELLRKSVISP
ncbi:MAG TPA: dTDP-4-dehydrorhamnose 3,5-epimerase [Ohtaekwangia sp.]|nr:dTDP-4-dehydrorhamnose 3,5-epimerase [Ohtaekwangia sp.]